MMNPQDWRRIKTILADAYEQPTAGRDEWIARACGDEALRKEVETFLAHEDQLDGFIDRPILGLTTGEDDGISDDDTARPRTEEMIGRQIGPYRLLSLLGEGGMGAVFAAERCAGFEQRVALKLVRPGLASPPMVRRFEEERQILAQLTHPNIARLLDGGTSDEGSPFFAMELIDGLAIDRYCDRHCLTTPERVDLFLPVCSALAAAHRRLVVHRDLKPSNILVDTTGTPKLLDFGIAKLLTMTGSDPPSAIALTRHQMMTPYYASPEQLRNEPIGTTSDVYTLGVVLYQVLTGHLPCGLEALDPVAAIRAVCEDEPLPASVVVRPKTKSRVTRRPTAVSRVRDGDVRTLRKRLSGDLDAILAKALRKNPDERYPSIEQLEEDLRRHREGLPVQARQGNLRYRATAFVRRHRLALAAVTVVVTMALFFTITLMRQLRATERARDQAGEVSAFLVELFHAAAPDRMVGQETTVRDLLERGRVKLERDLEQAPEVRATLWLRLGEVYEKLGDYTQATRLLQRSIGLFRQGGERDLSPLATALGNLAVVRFQAGDMVAAEAYCRESLALRERLGDEADMIKPRNTLATILLESERTEEAAAIYRQGLMARRAALASAPNDPVALGNLATSLRQLATALMVSGDLDPAEDLLAEALAIREQLYGTESTRVASVLMSLAHVARARGGLADAEALIVRVLTIRRERLGDDHLHTALAQRELGAVRAARGDWDGAAEPATSAVTTLGRSVAPADRRLAVAEGILGSVLVGQARWRSARPHLQRACRSLEGGPRRLRSRAMEPCTALRDVERHLGEPSDLPIDR